MKSSIDHFPAPDVFKKAPGQVKVPVPSCQVEQRVSVLVDPTHVLLTELLVRRGSKVVCPLVVSKHAGKLAGDGFGSVGSSRAIKKYS